ncbi:MULTISPECIES: LacI family DNA-binding transcriptional regulator [Catenuloplanes]|uniref:DNA-binding LacI/PurR family transcriptional regulator n=1 Tax=Catenuloplanes niger TaxID=587534 RepID=A0AAE4CSG8_9ACTN|nr:LacI family DNA-binding transcriptional regulator [Catenuloplanes niger]MDR7321268.1 DNA-binding LacI/PurR family transcriptional regulator [Catenuloplanes niger]
MTTDPRPRMSDLARALGVSQATVSNAFNRPDQLSAALRERILAAAREAGYAGPDPLANTFRRGRTGGVGLIIHEPLQYLFEDATARLTMAGVARACGEHGSSLVLVPRAEHGHPDVVSSALVDGFVAFCDPLEPERRELLRARRLPIIGLDAAVAPGEPFVGIDDHAAARSVAAHLAGLGHRRYGVISFPLSYDAAPGIVPAGLDAGTVFVANRARLAGYRDGLAPALADGGTAVVVAAAGVEERDGAAAARALLDLPQPPTAILAMGDRLALGAIDAAHARGIAVPDGLSVAGFDDIPAAATASLTTVRQPHDRKGSEAVHLLFRTAAEPLLLPTELIVRTSTAPPH